MTVAGAFARWASSLTLDDIPGPVRDAAARHLLDGLGCCLAAGTASTASTAGASGPVGRSGPAGTGADPALAVARSLGGPFEARIPGTDDRVSAPAAAFATGVLVHALDFDDTHAGGLVHATAVVLPAALAVGQQTGATGARVLTAAVAGYELVCRVGAATPHGFHARGLHATGVAGPLAAAAVSAVLMRLDPATMTHALGIAGSSSGGLLQFLADGASTKQLHPGSASLNGVLAARLAAAGATGPASVIEGENGVLASLSARPADAASIVEGLGERWETTQIGIKLYPACQLLHSSLDAAALLRYQVAGDRIALIEAAVHPDAAEIVCGPGKSTPRTPYDAKFSLPWSVAAMLVDGAVGIGTYQDFTRPDITALAARVQTTVTPAPDVAARAPGRLTITTTDGRTLTAVAPGAAPPPVTAVQAKFRANAGPGSGELAGRVLALATEPSLETIMDLMQKGR